MPAFGERARELMLARGVSLRALARRTHYDAGYLSKVLAGHKSLSADVASAIDAALDAGGALIGLAMTVRRTADQNASCVIDGHRVGSESGRPVDADYVDSLRNSIAHIVALDSANGSTDTSRLAARMYQATQRKLSAGAYLPSVERDLVATTAEFGELAGWLCFDAERQDDARRFNLEAFALSRQAGDRSMELFVLSNQAMQSVHTHRPREAMRISDSVIERDRLSGRVGAIFRVRRARALAALGARSAALDEFDHARAFLQDGIGTNDPLWTWWINERELSWHRGMVHASLDEWSEAVAHFRRAVENCDPSYRRGLYMHRVYLFEALIRVGSWSDAEDVLTEVLPLVDEVGSARAERLLDRVGMLVRQTGEPIPSTIRDAMTTIQIREQQ